MSRSTQSSKRTKKRIKPVPPSDALADDAVPAEDSEDMASNGTEDEDAPQPNEQVVYRGATNDPMFGYVVALALSLGLIPLIPESSDLRYTILWTVLAAFAVLAWLLVHSARIGRETPENLAWGAALGLIVGGPLFLFGGPMLTTTSGRLFAGMTTGTLLAYMIFVMPLAETLFFRGALQEMLAFWVVGLLASLWSLLVFFPLLDVAGFPVVAVAIGTVMVLTNLIYSYVRERNGLAAAWICQIIVNLAVLFLPTL